MPHTAITANRLLDGFVIYLTAVGGWSESLADAAIAATEAELDALQAAAERDARAGRVIGPYAFDVQPGADGPVPLGQRETLRTLGPSVRTDLGYQATRR